MVRIQGGLGNQMFQYAMARSLSLQMRTELFLDTWDYEMDTFRKYELERFNISARYLSKRRRDWEGQLQRRRYAPLKLLLQAIQSPLGSKHIVDIERGFDERLGKTNGNVYLNGFWQSERYFSGIRELLLREFTFKAAPNHENAKCLSNIVSQNSVCVHIRRGDYITTPHGQNKHGVCPLDYYHKAIAYIQDRLINPAFYIFSDDPAWVSLSFPQLNPMTIVSHNVEKNDSEDLRLMMNCKHFIIANSSFSWWGAWLGQFPNKTVIAPRRWYISPNHSDKDLVPESWIRM